MKYTLTLIVAILALISPGPAQGRPLENRMGAGLMLHDLNGLASLSFRYVPRNHMTLGFTVGFDTSASGFTLLGGRLTRNVDLQENINAYLGVAAYYLARSTAGVTSRGYEIDALMGVEAFLPGLTDLGLSFETGLGYRSLAGTTLKTIGNGFLGTAIHYYF